MGIFNLLNDDNKRQNYKRIFRVIFNNFFFLIITVIVGFVIFPFYLYYKQNKTLFPTLYRIFTQISLGVWGGLITSLLFSWTIYVFRYAIRKLFGLSKSFVIRLPLMLASSPFILAKKFHIFERNDLEIELDFRYAGIDALSDLQKGVCNLAVASDIALIRYMGENYDFKVYTLPFVKIKNHIKILVADLSITDINGLSDKTIAFIKDSVHEHFIDLLCKKFCIEIKRIEADGIIDCFTLVSENKAQACIFWEPYYLSMEKLFHLKPIEIDLSYEWYLCLVAKNDFIRRNSAFEKDVFESLQSATIKCNTDHVNVAKTCITYMHPEFTGLNEDSLDKLLDGEKSHSHDFSLDSLMKKNFLLRLKSLYSSDKYKSAFYISDHLWPSFKQLE